MSNSKIVLLRNTAICVVFSALFVIIGGIVPVLSMLMLVIANAPMVFISVRYGLRTSVVAMIVCVLSLTFVYGDISSALISGIMSLLPGVIIGRAINGRFGFATIVYAGAGVILFGFLIQLILFNASGDGNGIELLVSQSIENIRQVTNETFTMLEQQNPGKFQELQKNLNGMFRQIRDVIFLYLPTMLIGTSLVLSYFILMVGIFVLHKTKAKRIIYRPFWGFIAPRSMCNLTMILFLITTFSSDSTIWTAALKNMTMLLYGYFAICGLSFIDYKFKGRVPSGYARAAVYLAVFFATYLFMGMLFQGLCILGMIDGVFGFRRLYKVGEKHGQNQ